MMIILISYSCTNKTSDPFNFRPRPEELVKDLPEELTVYRGGHPEGFAWSLTLENAEQYHGRNGFWDTSGKNVLSQRKIKRDDVLFIGEGDIEVVLRPKDKFDYEILKGHFRR